MFKRLLFSGGPRIASHGNLLQVKQLKWTGPTTVFSKQRRCFQGSYSTTVKYDSPENSKPDEKPSDRQHVTGQRGRGRQSTRKPSLRGAALDASVTQQSSKPKSPESGSQGREKLVTAYCVATNYNFPTVRYLLSARGIRIDPCKTSLSQQVIHIEMPISDPSEVDPLKPVTDADTETGDVFIFPSGSVIAWNVPEASVIQLIQVVLWEAGEGHHTVEDEDFEYIEDQKREKSEIKAETIVLGTKVTQDSDPAVEPLDGTQEPVKFNDHRHRHVSILLAKVAFSAGLARSTKLAVLENRLEQYLEGTKNIPERLMSGNLGSFSRSFIYLKMGQLLDLRRQLNLSSDITDSLPDIFWDTGPDLGLEAYYNRMSTALDTRQRIVSLNEKMDYSHEIASILREELSVIREQQSEKHSTRLEWIIIILITVEVMFGSYDLYQKSKERENKD